MMELTLVCLLCAEGPDLSLVRQPARCDTLLQTTAPGGAESRQRPAASSPSTGEMVLTLGAVAGVSLLGYGVGLAGEFDVLAVMASVPLAAAGGVAAAEALAGYPVQWRAFWEGAVLGGLVGWGVMYLVGTFIDWVAPGAMGSPWGSGSEVSWGQFFFVGASVSLMTSAWAAGGYSTQVSPR